MPISTNLRSLHDLIQTAMPWESYYLYEFAVGDRVYGEPDPEDASWGRKIYQAKSPRLGMLIDRGISKFNYAYDFGNDWRYRVVIGSASDADPDVDYPIFAGRAWRARRAPPAEIGGPPGFMDFIAAISKRKTAYKAFQHSRRADSPKT